MRDAVSGHTDGTHERIPDYASNTALLRSSMQVQPLPLSQLVSVISNPSPYMSQETELRERIDKLQALVRSGIVRYTQADRAIIALLATLMTTNCGIPPEAATYVVQHRIDPAEYAGH